MTKSCQHLSGGNKERNNVGSIADEESEEDEPDEIADLRPWMRLMGLAGTKVMLGAGDFTQSLVLTEVASDLMREKDDGVKVEAARVPIFTLRSSGKTMDYLRQVLDVLEPAEHKKLLGKVKDLAHEAAVGRNLLLPPSILTEKQWATLKKRDRNQPKTQVLTFEEFKRRARKKSGEMARLNHEQRESSSSATERLLKSDYDNNRNDPRDDPHYTESDGVIEGNPSGKSKTPEKKNQPQPEKPGKPFPPSAGGEGKSKPPPARNTSSSFPFYSQTGDEKKSGSISGLSKQYGGGQHDQFSSAGGNEKSGGDSGFGQNSQFRQSDQYNQFTQRQSGQFNQFTQNSSGLSQFGRTQVSSETPYHWSHER